MSCLCGPSKSKQNDTGVSPNATNKGGSKNVTFLKDEDDQTATEFIPPAVPRDLFAGGGGNFNGGEEVLDIRESLVEGGREVENRDSQVFFDARESTADFKSVTSSALFHDARSVTSSAVFHDTQSAQGDEERKEVSFPESTESNQGTKLSADALSKHDREDPPQNPNSGTAVRGMPTRAQSYRQGRRHSLDAPGSLLKKRQSIRQKSVRMIRNSINIVAHLRKPRVKIEENGYPGNLTQKQLDACVEFRAALRERASNPSYKDGDVYSDMVFAFSEVEEEAYSICRFLRARDFDVKKTFEMLDGTLEIWKEASKHNFYPDLENEMGCPTSVFLTQYPNVYQGNSTLGFPMNYFHAGKFSADGVNTLTTMDALEKYIWKTLKYDLPEIFKNATEMNPDFVRCEIITVANLEGLTRAQLGSESIDILKKASSVGDCFPEILHKAVVINAPSFFAVSWRLIRNFLDPGTAKKIEIISNKKKGQKRLAEIIDENLLPSDFDGKGPSIEDNLRQNSAKNGDKPPSRRIVELMRLKKGGGVTSLEFNVKSHENVRIRVYTKTALGAHFSIYKCTGDPKSHAKTPVLENMNVKRPDGDASTQFSACLIDDLKGAGEYVLEGMSEKKTKAEESFLVVGEVYSGGVAWKEDV